MVDRHPREVRAQDEPRGGIYVAEGDDLMARLLKAKFNATNA